MPSDVVAVQVTVNGVELPTVGALPIHVVPLPAIAKDRDGVEGLGDIPTVGEMMLVERAPEKG